MVTTLRLRCVRAVRPCGGVLASFGARGAERHVARLRRSLAVSTHIRFHRDHVSGNARAYLPEGRAQRVTGKALALRNDQRRIDILSAGFRHA